MLVLFHAPQSRSSRFIWLLEEIGRPYDLRPVSIFRPLSGEGAPDARNPHPDKQAPCVMQGDEIVAESVAIALYLTDAFPDAGLGPCVSEPGRGAYLTWLAWYAASVEPSIVASLMGELDGEGPGPAGKRRTYEMMVRRLEGALSSGPYLMGERFTAADVLACSALQWARNAFPPSRTLDAYVARCEARPAAVRAAAKDGASGVQSPT